MKGVWENKVLFAGITALFVCFLIAGIITEKYYLVGIPFVLLLFYSGWQSLSFLFFLLIISLSFSMEYQFSDSLGTDIPDEGLMLLTSALFFLHITNDAACLYQQLRHPLILVLAALLTWTVISVLFSTYPVLSIKFLLAKGWYLASFLGAAILVCRTRRGLYLLASCLAIPMLLVTLIIMIRHGSMGLGFMDINEAVQPFFRNHVNYSSMLVCILPLWWAAWKLSRKYHKTIFVVLVILLAAVFLSYARGAWLALLTGIGCAWLIRRKWLMRASMVLMLCIAVALCWLSWEDRYLHYAPDHNTTIFHEDFGEHLVATYEMKDMSAYERVYRWVAGFRMIPDHWVTGFGPGTFYENYQPYAVPAFSTWVSDNEEHSTVHNYFLLTAVEQGLPGLLLLLLLAGLVLYYAQKIYHRAEDPFFRMAGMITGVIFSMILTLNFLSDLVETDKIGSLFFLCVAVLVVLDGYLPKEKPA